MSESESPHKWSRKRPAEDDLEDISREEVSWKVKTLDEILQEKRKRLAEENTGNEEQEKEEEHEISRPESRESSGAASPGSVKRGRNASSSPVELPTAEVIYQLSPSQNSYSSSSSEGMTPSNIKLLPHQLSKDKLQHKQKRRQTEEEEGEIVSDGSDHEGEEKSKSKESRKANVNEVKEQQSTEGGREKINSPNNSDDNDDDASESESEEEKFVPSDEKTTQKMVQNKDEQDVESEDSDESDSESGDDSEAKSSNDDVVTETVKDKKEKAVYKDKKRDVSIMKQNDDDEVEDDTDVSADENDNDEDNDEDDEDDDDNDDDDDDGSEEESDSDDDSTEESESESENEQVTEQHSVKKARRIGVQGHDDEELEDLHKELLQATESQRKKEEGKKRERYDLERSGRDRSYKNDDHRQRPKDYTHSSDDRKHYDRRKRKAEEQELKNYFPREKSYEKRESRLKEKSNERSSSVRKVVENSYSKEAVGLRELQKEKYHTSSREVSSKSSKRDIGKSKRKSPREIDSSRKDTKSLEKLGKESKDSGDYRREPREERRRKQYEKQKDAEKSSKSTKAVVSKDLRSSILTEQERKQFSQEVVDFDSDGGSSTEENAHGPLLRKNHHNDVEMLSDKDDDKEPETPKLPLYLPAIKGCRNVEEFQWLNRIEEGTYGVVYRAKDKRTSEIVALKRLKMEKEKEGFPITSLREINTLLKAQHPNIVTVREIVVGSNMDKIYIVMDYVEHDLKALMEHMPNSFLAGEVKTLMIQLLRAVAHLHDNWILHRDLKTSNLLLSNKGILKVGDFGLAREYGSPLRNYTPIVVTLWYRAPELLLGVKEYSTPIDLWSVGCIFAELLTMKPLFPGSSEIDQINKIFKELGTPSDRIWPGPPSYSELPAVKKMNFTEYPYNNLRNKFGAHLTDKGFDLLNRFLTYDPKKRVTAEQALEHGFFDESPLPVDPAMFPSWPAKSELVKGPKRKNYEHSPRAPEGGAAFSKLGDDDSGGFHIATLKKGSKAVAGFSLKF